MKNLDELEIALVAGRSPELEERQFQLGMAGVAHSLAGAVAEYAVYVVRAL